MIWPWRGNDTINGFTGNDTLIYRELHVPIRSDYNESKVSIFELYEKDTVTNVENIIATNYSDNIIMDDGINVVWAEGGDDHILLLRGNDTVYGGILL